MNNSLVAKFRSSAQELSNVKGISLCAMLLALRVVVGYFANFSLAITPNAKVGFAFLPIAITGMLFGPVGAMIVGGLGDVLSFLLVPMGGYFFGWTLNGILVGLLYGLFLYKADSKILLRLIICEIIINFGVEVPLGSLWLYIQFDKAFWVMAGTRAIKCLIALPIETVLVFFFKNVLKRVKI
ncbi:MAG: folate family ECF transporter S component [Ruminococcaceae bacterium]|nr:folate family ECF transporter S component [Oscillospiraceae bacterium]